MKIVYKDNDATKIPVRISGKAIEITQWLRGEQYVPYLKDVFAFSKEKKEEEEEYDDGQGRRYDILDGELE